MINRRDQYLKMIETMASNNYRPTRPALEAVFRDRPEYFEPDCECGAVASEHCPACEPVAQEPVAFYIYKETAPRLGIQNVVADSLPWVYDQDPSSGFSARLKVYLAPPDQSAEVSMTPAASIFKDEVARLNAEVDRLRGNLHAMKQNALRDVERIAELERQRDVLAKLLCRYRNETPPGHQPHMIAHEVDAALASKISALENRAELLAEDIECLQKCLDDAGAPRDDGNGNAYSMWGRVLRLINDTPNAKLTGGGANE